MECEFLIRQIFPRLKGNGADQSHGLIAGLKNDAFRSGLDVMKVTAKIKCGRAFKSKGDGSTDHGEHPDDLVAARPVSGFVRFDGHEVSEFADSIMLQKPGQQDIGFGQVHLSRIALYDGGNLEVPSNFLVKNGCK